MVRSMMNLTTLPYPFGDYALESATRILNMVPTKKVDKTPYELWYGKVPNLSYLKVWGCEALVKRDTPEQTRTKIRLDLNKSQGAQTPNEVNRMKNVPYASAVGSIMYAVRCTRPDVAFAQNMTSRFQQNPGEPHWTAVKNILKLIEDDIKSQQDMFFVPEWRRSGLDELKAKVPLAMSATESEIIAASEAAMEVF
ncbi:hypothetical protein Tco_1533504 [Tanacetum coccineum]